MRKKPRLSIIVQIAIVFVIAMSLSIGLIPFFGKYYLMKRAVSVNQDTAEGVANLVRYYIEPRLPMSSLSEEHLNQTRELFRELCINFHFRYVYLYTPVEDGIMYYICAAEDDHMHEEIQKIRAYGTIVKRAPYQAETDILAGEKDAGCGGAGEGARALLCHARRARAKPCRQSPLRIHTPPRLHG